MLASINNPLATGYTGTNNENTCSENPAMTATLANTVVPVAAFLAIKIYAIGCMFTGVGSPSVLLPLLFLAFSMIVVNQFAAMVSFLRVTRYDGRLLEAPVSWVLLAFGLHAAATCFLYCTLQLAGAALFWVSTVFFSFEWVATLNQTLSFSTGTTLCWLGIAVASLFACFYLVEFAAELEDTREGFIE